MIVLTSGGFDPLHIGHLNYLEAAASLAQGGFSIILPLVTVALNSDDYIIRKKGYCFMPWDERARILSILRCVERVIPNNDGHHTIGDVLRIVRPDIFAYGGDRFSPDPEAHKVCVELGIKELFGIGGEKIRSSSQMVSMNINRSNL